jgi:hypothetical protein
MRLPPGLTTGGVTVRRWAADRVERLLLPHRRRRWAIALGGAAVLVCVAATAPIMAGTGHAGKGRAGRASPSVSASLSASVSAAVRFDAPADLNISQP